MASVKYTNNISLLRSIRNELNKVINNKNVKSADELTTTITENRKNIQDGTKRDPSIEHMLGLFRDNQVTEERFCRPEDHYKYFAETYLTYLRSSRLQDELTRKYFHKADRSVESSARLVGLELPKQSC